MYHTEAYIDSARDESEGYSMLLMTTRGYRSRLWADAAEQVEILILISPS